MRTFEAISGEWLQEPEQPLRPITIENMHTGVLVQQRSHLTAGQGRQLSKLVDMQQRIKFGNAGAWENAVDFLPNSKRKDG
jgi:hypothetical protein